MTVSSLFRWSCVNCTSVQGLYVPPDSTDADITTLVHWASLVEKRRLAQVAKSVARHDFERRSAAAVKVASAQMNVESEGDKETSPPGASSAIPTAPLDILQQRATLPVDGAFVPVSPDLPNFDSLYPLPDVPPPPAVPRHILLRQRCPCCGAQYMDASGSANAPLYEITDRQPNPTDVDATTGQNLVGDVPESNLAVLRHTIAAPAGSVDSIIATGVGTDLAAPTDDAALTAAIAAALRSTPHLHPALGASDRKNGGFAPVVALTYDSAMLLHEEVARPGGALPLFIPGVQLPPQPRSSHPERPDRTRAIAQHLLATGILARCVRVPARFATPEELQLVHSEPHVVAMGSLAEAVRAADGDLHFGSDTFANSATASAALLACGSVTALVESVMDGRAERGIAIVRPPGHHAEPNDAMGFCLCKCHLYSCKCW